MWYQIMISQFYKKLTFTQLTRIIFLLVTVSAVIHYFMTLPHKSDRCYINGTYHYKVAEMPGFDLVENQPLETVVFDRVIRKKRIVQYCDNIFYGVDVKVIDEHKDYYVPNSEEDFYEFRDAFKQYNADSIMEDRGYEIVDVKPNHKGIFMAYVLRNQETGLLDYYYDTRVWAYGNMYSIFLRADIETATSEKRADRDKDYSYTYKKIIDSIHIEENIRDKEVVQ